MRVTQTNIRKWLEKADKENASHVVVMSDDYSHEYYPIACSSEEVAREPVRMKDGHNMQSMVEVYNLSASWAAQLLENRCVNY